MSLQIVFLGTGGSVPTVERSLPAIALRRKGELILFDCGEGVQRQMVRASLGLNRKMKVFITHMHGDHVLGLPGLIQTMSLLDRTKVLEIYGPTGLEDFIEAIEKTVRFTLTFPLEVAEVEHEGLICEETEYEVYAAWTDHSAPGLAYGFVEKPRPGRFYPDKAKALGVPEGVLWSKLQHGERIKMKGKAVEPEDVIGPARPGRKIVYTGDSRSSKGLVKLAKKADLLIHDCTFDDDLAERAEEDGHSTPSQAAQTAKKAGARRLILTHISARYKTTDMLLKQAKKTFPNVNVAEDFMEISLPLPES
ncbi:MAG: ribonuclease Z [Candidatus Bathyarchaeia archaeon]